MNTLERIITYTFAAFYSFLILLRLTYYIILDGLNVFKVKCIDVPPFIINDSRLGKHGYIQLKKQAVKLHYVEKGDRSNPLMLLLHGFPECWLSWRHQLKEFSTNYWVVAVDMRGYGESDKPKGKKNYDINVIVEDIKEMVMELGSSKTVIVGHDWGSVIAWKAVQTYPDLFEKHINLNGPPIEVMMSMLRSSFKQFKMSWYIFFFQCPILPEITSRIKNLAIFSQLMKGQHDSNQQIPKDAIEGFKYYYSKSGAFTPPINYYRCLPTYNDRAYMKKVIVPTLIIWGDQDTALNIEIPAKSSNLCEDAQIEYIRNTGHFVHEEKPDQVNEVIWKFLNSK
ncbi:UNVERIFIED_CONTAM: hypothetical protein RMT77_011929 [Armadillidium vulgare]